MPYVELEQLIAILLEISSCCVLIMYTIR